ncbi:MAG: squalene cyclase [Planctomycetota bacterium]|jgi:squalene cyclase
MLRCFQASLAAVLLPLCAGQVSAQVASLPPGVTPEIQKAILRGQAWLESNQAADGSWRNGGSYGTYPAAMTAMGGMAILAGGSTPTRGKHWQQVRKATEWLLKRIDAQTGFITLRQQEQRGMYGHGLATLFLASVYGMEEDQRTQKRLKRVLDGAVALISNSQSAAGGWYYQPSSTDDEGSVTVTQIQALRACRMAGIVVDKKTINRAVNYIKRCQNPDGGICYKLSMKGSQSKPALTAAGVAVLYNAGVYDDQPFVDNAVKFCKRRLKVSVDNTGHHYYTILYWSQVLYQRGGKDWDDYYNRAGAWLLKQQAKDGSWSGDGIGSVYGTAVALTILQMPHSLVPIYQR